MDWGAWRSRIWVAALATTAWPSGEPSRSPASWVTTVSPAQCLRADLAMRKRNSAPDGSDMSSHASSTITSRRLRLAGSDTRRQMASRVSSVPAAFSSSGRSRRREDDEVAVGAGGGRPVEEAPVGAGHERRQPGGQGPGGRVAVGVERGGQVARAAVRDGRGCAGRR